MNNNPIEVTFLFKNEDAFRKFVKKNCNDEYTYRKGKYIVDMTEEVKASAAEAASKAETTEVVPSVEDSSVTSDDLPPATPTESMF